MKKRLSTRRYMDFSEIRNDRSLSTNVCSQSIENTKAIVTDKAIKRNNTIIVRFGTYLRLLKLKNKWK